MDSSVTMDKVIGALIMSGSASATLMSGYLAVTSFFANLRLPDHFERVISGGLTITAFLSFLPAALMAGGAMMFVGDCNCPSGGGSDTSCRPRISC